MDINTWSQIQLHILQLEQEGLLTRTFRRLDPERQQAILLAILDEAVEKGPASLNIKQVAHRAGVSVGSLYQYFNNRDGLLTFAVEICTRFISGAFNSYRPYLKEMPLADGLAAYLMGGIEWSQTEAGLIRFFARAAYHSDSELSERVVRPIAGTMRLMVGDILSAAVERGELRPGVDIEAVTRIIHALMIAIGDSQLLPYLNTYLQVTDETVSSERVLAALLDFILRGIGTPPS